ncbi:MAG: hypothetical protein GYB68_19275, partial [Chloroflexi bacterium]|nr:hypothetical protein [Chloroflexota bacterium]
MPYPYRYAPHAEVLGAAASATVNHLRRAEVLPSLEKHGLLDIQAEEWYPVDKFVHVFEEWYASHTSVMADLVSVGMAIIDNMVLPPNLDALATIDKLMLIGQLHDMQHRGGDPGGYKIELLDDYHIRYTEDTVYPDHMIYGYIYGIARRFLGRDH